MADDLDNEKENILTVERRKPKADAAATAASPSIYVVAVVALAAVVVLFVFGLQVLQPTVDHTSTITMILGFMVPIVTALLGGAVVQLGKRVDGRLNQLLAMTARTYAAEGELEGRRKLREQIAAAPPPVVVVPPPPQSIPVNGGHLHSRADDKPEPQK